MSGRWSALRTNMSLCWWLYVWAVCVLMVIAQFRQDARFFGIDFIGFFIFHGIVCLIYLFFAEIVPPFWWLVTLPWRLRSRPLAAVAVVAAVALWLALLFSAIPRYYGAWGQLVFGMLSEMALVGLYRFVRYRRRKRSQLVESALS